MIALRQTLFKPGTKNSRLGSRCVSLVLALAFLLACLLGWPGELPGQTSQNPLHRFKRNPANTQMFASEPRSPLDRYRIRIVWGGGESAVWRGSLRLTEGSFENVTTLGLEPDAGAALQAVGNELRIRPTRASDFNGLDVDITGARDQTLILNLVSVNANAANGIEQHLIDLTPLIKNDQGNNERNNGIQLALDDTGNRIDFSRTPGDRIPVKFGRDHLVFAPGESFEFSLQPFLGIRESGDNAKLQLTITEADQNRNLFSEQYPLAWDGNLFSMRDPIRIAMPSDEGVYHVNLAVKDESLTGRLSLNRQTLTRSFQVVVVDPVAKDRQPTAEQVVMWSEIYNSEDVGNQWIDRISRFRMVSSGSKSGPIGNSGVSPEIIDGKTWLGFSPGGWQAVPLQITETGKPHIVEIEYLDDGPMALGISVLQPSAAGQIEPFGIDSGISIPDRTGIKSEPTTRRHRIFFWPDHEKPYLLFANRHQQRAARIGSIRVLSGPDRLAESNISKEVSEPRRKYMAFYEKPFFVENFSGPKAIDPETGVTWHDWNSFLTSAIRWTQYLKANGYNSAMLVVAADGSAYYPSSLIQPNTRFDSGAMSPSGTDPIRKDVVELLLRVFEREGLKLIPVFHFNSPLHELENQRLTGSPESEGIVLTDAQGTTRLPSLQTSANPPSIYNPLDSRVQEAHLNLIREFTNRYRDRESYKTLGGLGFLYSQDSLLVMPGQTWGVDRTTLTQFLRDTNLQVGSGANWLAQLLNGEGRVAWMQWRQRRMAGFLDQLQQITSKSSRLYLLGSDMFETQDAFSALAPSLRRNGDMVEAMARIAFPNNRVAGDKNIVFLQPNELAPEQSLADNRLNIQLNHTADGLQAFREYANGGTLFSHRYTWAEFEQLRQQRIFGQPQQQSLMRLQPLAPAGMWNRKRMAESLAESDSQTLVEGGWLTGFGQEEHVAGFVEEFTSLPDIRFQDVSIVESAAETGVVVRQAAVEGRNWFYVVNPTPWTLTANIHLSSNNTIVESAGVEISFDNQSEKPQLVVPLEPFSLRVASVNEEVQVVGFQVTLPDEATNELQNRLNALLTKVSRAAQVDPINVLENPGFEAVSETGEGPRSFGWSYDNSAADVVTMKYEGSFEGQSALTMFSRGTPTWIRSVEFPTPETGRLSVSVMLRTDDPSTQPTLRICVYGDDGQQVYYRYGIVGGESRQITSEWQEFAVHFDDLPLQESGRLQVEFDLMGSGQVDLDQVRLFDRWLDAQDSRSLTQLLALAGFQLTNKQNVDRCRRILDGYWPRFLEEFFPDEIPDAVMAEDDQKGTRASRAPESSSNR